MQSSCLFLLFIHKLPNFLSSQIFLLIGKFQNFNGKKIVIFFYKISVTNTGLGAKSHFWGQFFCQMELFGQFCVGQKNAVLLELTHCPFLFLEGTYHKILTLATCGELGTLGVEWVGPNDGQEAGVVYASDALHFQIMKKQVDC